MNKKILVVDDSPTIQKLISVALGHESFELFQCFDVENLFDKVKAQNFDLILLDFNLSQEKSALEILKEISGSIDETPVIFMMGAFDTIEDEVLKESGVRDKIAKPIDGQDLLLKCRTILFNASSLDLPDEILDQERSRQNEAQKETLALGELDDNNWVMNSSSADEYHEDDSRQEETSIAYQGNYLQNEIAEWGFPIPPIIGQDEEDFSLVESIPSIPEETSHVYSEGSDFSKLEEDNDSISTSTEFDRTDPTFEYSSSDIQLNKSNSYHEDDSSSEENVGEEVFYDSPETTDEVFEETESEANKEEPHSPKSALISLDELQQEEEIEEENGIELNLERDLEMARDIGQDLEESTSSNIFWSADEEESLSEEISSPLLNQYEEERDEERHTQDPIIGEVLEEKTEEIQNSEEIVAILLDKIKPMMKEMLKEFCKESVEKISWEVIPDLAENIIRSELKEISNNLKESQ